MHCGDVCDRWDDAPSTALSRFDDWCGRQRAPVVIVGGNHDSALEEAGELRHATVLTGTSHLHHASDEPFVIYGAPWVPVVDHGAYNRHDDQLRSLWQQIHSGAHLLVTHTPPRGTLDQPQQPRDRPHRPPLEVGCRELRGALSERERLPLVHVFGHVHASGGQVVEADGMLSANVSAVGSVRGAMLRPPLRLRFAPGPWRLESWSWLS